MRYTNEQSLKEVIKEFIDLYQLAPKLNEKNLIASWEKVVGKMIAKHTTHIYVNKKTVFIQLDSAALKAELSLAKTKLIKNINKSLGNDAIQDIVFL
jgi:predicted nucleic acid-binding Zn ribbon protein